MVVVLLYATPTVTTVLGTHWTHCLAAVADVEDGIVVVFVVTPCCRIADLLCVGEGVFCGIRIT